jgi:hypothetical protein
MKDLVTIILKYLTEYLPLLTSIVAAPKNNILKTN